MVITSKDVKKLYTYQVEGAWGLGFGCSGTSAACTNFTDRLLELLRGSEQGYDRRGTEKLIEATMNYMRQQYPSERLDVILGLWGNHPLETRLYRAHSETQCLSIESDYACAGLDVSLARFLLDSIFENNFDFRETLDLGVFVTAIMKKKADGVGGPTQVLYYPLGHNVWEDDLPRSAQTLDSVPTFKELEESTLAYWHFVRGMANIMPLKSQTSEPEL